MLGNAVFVLYEKVSCFLLANDKNFVVIVTFLTQGKAYSNEFSHCEKDN